VSATTEPFDISGAGTPAQPDTREPRAEIETHGYLCTGCPLGCRLEVDAIDGDVVEVRGFSCKRGERYGRQEHVDPRRPLSTTVWIEGASIRRVPVRSADAIPKAMVLEVAHALRGVRLRAPVHRGDVVLADALGTGVDVIVTRDLGRVGAP
jgi:CxxC motif-containing protein